MKKFLGIVVLILLNLNIAQADSIPDLTNSKWEVRKPTGTKKYWVEFFANGKCQNSRKSIWMQTFKDCVWKQSGDQVYFSINNNYVRFKGKVSSNSMSGSYDDNDQNKALFNATPIFITNYIALKPKEIEQPKKKKPIASPDDNKIVPAGSGSGFFVSKDGHAITNYHVIEGCDINKLSFKGSQTEVKVLAVDKVNDIAILKSNAKPDVIFPVSNEDVSLLEDVIVAGFPLGKQISSAIKTHKGVVTALAGAGDNYSFFQTDAAINQGNSGGPIINQKGNVVGIAVATWVEEGVQGVHFGIKSSTLKTFASANGLNFASPNYRDLSNKDLGKLITKGTVYVECHMTVAKIKKMIAQAENRKAFFKEHK
jgi:S1-C subfamily serine protease